MEDKRKLHRKEEKIAVEFVNEIHKQFTDPIIDNINKFLDIQKDLDDAAKYDLRKVLMFNVANGILIRSGARKKEIKQNYRGLIADYEKLEN